MSNFINKSEKENHNKIMYEIRFTPKQDPFP